MNEEINSEEVNDDAVEKKVLVCSDCGKTIDPDCDDYYETSDGRIICESCYDLRYFRCEDCGKIYQMKDAVYAKGGRLICDGCRDDYVKCRDCDEWIHLEDAYSLRHGEYVCDDCYSLNYFTCERCEEIFHNNNGQWIGDNHYCDSCADAECHEQVVMDYHKFEETSEYRPVKCDGEKVGKYEPYLGVELECDDGDFDGDDFSEWMDNDWLVHFERDGSLSDDGVEMITQPCTLKYHQESIGWHRLCKRLLSQGFRSHNASCCGLHVHMTRSKIPVTSVVKMDIWLNRWRLWRDVARRSSIYNGSYDDNKKADIGHAVYNVYQPSNVALKWAGRGYNDRYQPLNTENSGTIEIRIFRGTLNHETVLGTLEMCHALVMFANSVPIARVYDTKPEDFLSFISGNLNRYKNVFPMLARLIKEDEPYAVREMVRKVNEKIEKEDKKCA